MAAKLSMSVVVSSPAHEKLLREVADATAGVAPADVTKPAGLSILIRRLAERHAARDPLTAARLRGIVAQEALVADALTSAEVAALLGITRQAVDKRRSEGKLLALSPPKRGNRYPAWQFDENGVLDGLEAVLGALKDHDAWTQARFMTSGNDRLAGKTPVARMRAGDVASVLRAATMLDAHGAP